MKKITAAATAVLLAVFCAFSAFAADGGIGWFFRKNTEGRQPALPAELSMIRGHNVLWLDSAHGDDSDEKVIYLTFDFGYENGNVEKILDALDENGVKGSFFVLKQPIVKNTGLVRRMFENGHLVCNHTTHHKDMTKISTKEAFSRELCEIETVCKEYTGYDLARFYRPPEGRFHEEGLQWADELGYTTVFWSFAYADWDNAKQPDPGEAKKKILSHVHNGEILLLHPTSATNAAILGDLIKELKNEGYEFRTLDTFGM